MNPQLEQKLNRRIAEKTCYICGKSDTIKSEGEAYLCKDCNSLSLMNQLIKHRVLNA